jgi:uncharacterized protein DUF5656
MDSSSLFEVEDEAPSNTARGSDYDATRRTPAEGDQGLLLTTETEPAPSPFVPAAPSGGEDEAGVLDIRDGQSSDDEDWTGGDVPDVPAVAYEERTPGPANLQPGRLALLVGVYAIGVLLYLAVQPAQPLILLVTTALVSLGADGLIRTHPKGDFQGDIAGTAPFLFLPALYTLGSGLFLEDVADGYWAVPGVILAAVFLSWVMYAEFLSVDDEDRLYPFARLVLNVGTYLTAFAFFAVVYTFDVSLVPAAIAVGLVTLLLSVEVLREAEADPLRALVYAAVIGIVVAEARWDLYFLPLESYLAAVFLLLVFYLGSGLVQHHLTDDLRPPVVAEFLAIAIIGLLIVAAGRIFESTVTLGP